MGKPAMIGMALGSRFGRFRIIHVEVRRRTEREIPKSTTMPRWDGSSPWGMLMFEGLIAFGLTRRPLALLLLEPLLLEELSRSQD